MEQTKTILIEKEKEETRNWMGTWRPTILNKRINTKIGQVDSCKYYKIIIMTLDQAGYIYIWM
jgi:hypothetical protein